MNGKWKKLVIGIVLVATAAGCGTGATPVPPTQPPPTEASLATATPLPTATQPLPTATQPLPTATQPPPTATFAPEVLASRIEDVVGVWLVYAGGEKAHQVFTAEGTFHITGVSDAIQGMTLDDGKFWFEGTQLKFESTGGCVTSQEEVVLCIGIYQVYVTKQGDKPVRLRFIMVDDQDADRKGALSDRTLSLAEP